MATSKAEANLQALHSHQKFLQPLNYALYVGPIEYYGSTKWFAFCFWYGSSYNTYDSSSSERKPSCLTSLSLPSLVYLLLQTFIKRRKRESKVNLLVQIVQLFHTALLVHGKFSNDSTDILLLIYAANLCTHTIGLLANFIQCSTASQ